MNTLIAFDESGNTGENLVDLSQPYFTLASVNFSKEDLEKFENFFTIKSSEYHFKQLKRNQRHQKSMLDFFNSDLISDVKMKYSAFDKQFATTCQIVDLLIEPIMFKGGLDLYEDGAAYGYASVLYALLSSGVYGSNALLNLNEAFVKMMRSKTDESKAKFYNVILGFPKSMKDDKYMDMFVPILSQPEEVSMLVDSYEKYQIDFTFTSFFILNGKWTNTLKPSRYDVLIDHSKQLGHFEELISISRSRALMENSNFTGHLSDVEFPMAINQFSFVNSETYIEVQVADLIASAVNFALVNAKDTKNLFAKDLMDSRLFSLPAHIVAFDKDFLDNIKNRDNSMTYIANNLGVSRSRFGI
ncbi:DUF3800 domain-containing protein [Neolewinella lacunae]|uniref:DUF3800 domain-containing protein n=1 Tax=Neolewinella lacunae TaxID=1517758 RepID=A0A923T9D1_9BACT|nr:DUF3800 domain-containing protein [Neolewinella lacunae]MBC6995441.1 DUF3800 domain-containing protein [Neolewinella lacunae]MDN3635028.1 DUF3800 domain-containing protein [Neolewinella lacunae]